MRGRTVPDCKVRVEGTALSPEDDAALLRVEVELDVDLFGAAILQFHDPSLRLINGAQFRPGTTIDLSLGYGSRLGALFSGEVVAVEPAFRRDHPVSLRVVCLESLHRLALSTMSRALADVDDQEIVSQIARAHGLSGEAPAGTREHMVQANVSDATFLRRMAQRQGQHVRIEGKRLVLGDPPRGEDVVLDRASGLRRMHLKLKAGQQVSAVAVHGYDPRSKQGFVGTCAPEGEPGEGARAHGRGARLAFAGQEAPPLDVSTADRMAKGRMRKLAEGFAVAHLELAGDARVKPGALLSVEGLGAPLEGRFRVEHALHRWSRGGYLTSARAVRVARRKPPRPVATPASAPKADWIEIELLDHRGAPVGGQRYRVEAADGQVFEGRLDAAGKARIGGVKAGNNYVSFPGYDPAWRRA